MDLPSIELSVLIWYGGIAALLAVIVVTLRHRSPRQAFQTRIQSQIRRAIRKNQFESAAALLETAGFVEDAIDLLIYYELTDPAVRMLKRHNKFIRAAKLLMAQNLFDQAIACFHQGKRPDLAAHCAMHNGDPLRAARIFEAVGQKREAAKCYTKANQFERAIRVFIDLKDRDAAFRVIRRWVAHDRENFMTVVFGDAEIDQMMDRMRQGVNYHYRAPTEFS